ncbi:MAG: hypothetical protein HOM86_09640, partial [Gemmatimonadetes bacterium]|nr:hypothetical protein [Gemmatimonadota bacterium]
MPQIDGKRVSFYLGLLALFVWALYLRWPLPAPEWQHVDERAFILHPLGFWSGDLNPHFFNYPTLHFYLASALYYLYYLSGDFVSLDAFVAYRYFVDGGDLIEWVRGFNSVLSALTGGVCALIGRRLYGAWGGWMAGGLFSVLPLSVRFAHLAIVDVPLAWWSLLALYFAVRVVEDGRMRDVLWGGLFAGLAMATKYPGGLAWVPVGLACGWRFGWLRGPFWWSGLTVAAVFVVCSPYVLLDWSSAWGSIAAMGSEHMMGEGHGGEGTALWHHLRYNLRYGVGLLGLLGLVGGLALRWRSYRRSEWLVVAALASWLVLLGVSSSVFMRYALPLGGLVVVLWVRGLMVLGGPVWWRWVLVVVLGAEPLYGAYQTRSLLVGEDTRIMAQQWIEENAPPGTYLVHFNSGAGRLRAIHPGGIYIRQNYYLKYYSASDLIRSYSDLAKREDLPPFYVSLKPRAGVDVSADDFVEAPSHGLIVDYRHPLTQTDKSAASKKLIELAKWAVEFDPGSAMGEAVYDAVDWYFLPIGSFGGLERTGPYIRIGVVPVKIGAPMGGFDSVDLTGPKIQLGKVPVRAQARGLDSAVFFGVLHGILLGAEKVKSEDWPAVLELYEAIWKTPLPLYRIL